MRHFHKQPMANFQPGKNPSSALGRDPVLHDPHSGRPVLPAESGYQRKVWPATTDTTEGAERVRDTSEQNTPGLFHDKNAAGYMAPNQYGHPQGNNMELYGNKHYSVYGINNRQQGDNRVFYGNKDNSYGSRGEGLHGNTNLNPHGGYVHTHVDKTYGVYGNAPKGPVSGYPGYPTPGPSSVGYSQGGYPFSHHARSRGHSIEGYAPSGYHPMNNTRNSVQPGIAPSYHTGPESQSRTTFLNNVDRRTGESTMTPPPRKLARIKIATSLLGPK